MLCLITSSAYLYNNNDLIESKLNYNCGLPLKYASEGGRTHPRQACHFPCFTHYACSSAVLFSVSLSLQLSNHTRTALMRQATDYTLRIMLGKWLHISNRSISFSLIIHCLQVQQTQNQSHFTSVLSINIKMI